MRTIDEIIADTQKLTEAALREAFDAGRAHAAADVKSKMTAFFDGLGHIAQPPVEPAPMPPEPDHQPEIEHPAETEHHFDVDHQSNQPHYD